MVISLPYIFQVLYVLCFTRPRYQVSIYKTIGPLFFLSPSRGLIHAYDHYFQTSETAWPIKAKFHIKGGTKICIKSHGYMMKMAVTPIYGKILEKSTINVNENI